jgi:hypothetical protein
LGQNFLKKFLKMSPLGGFGKNFFF